MEQVSFKERVRITAINEAKNYKDNYVDYEYLVCSTAFKLKSYYIINAREDNYQHLIGVNSLISAQVFFDKCYNGTLKETDFDFAKEGQDLKSVKGSVRRKIEVLPDMMNVFSIGTKVEESFKKNKISCSFAAADNVCTLGFTNSPKLRPMTLLKGNELDVSKMKEIDLLLRKKTGKEKFDQIIIGDSKVLIDYYEIVKEHIDECIIPLGLIKEIEEFQNTTRKEIASDLDRL